MTHDGRGNIISRLSAAMDLQGLALASSGVLLRWWFSRGEAPKEPEPCQCHCARAFPEIVVRKEGRSSVWWLGGCLGGCNWNNNFFTYLVPSYHLSQHRNMLILVVRADGCCGSAGHWGSPSGAMYSTLSSFCLPKGLSPRHQPGILRGSHGVVLGTRGG